MESLVEEESLLQLNTGIFNTYWEFVKRADNAVIKVDLGGVEGSGP